MYSLIIKFYIQFKNRVLDLSYTYGFFVADNSLYIILICIGIFLLSLFQITTNVSPLRNSLEIFTESAKRFHPVQARLELNQNDQFHDKRPDKPLWYSGYPLAYVQHIIVRCSSLTSRSSCLLQVRQIRERLFADPQFDNNCLRVSEPIKTQEMLSYLPSFGCLFLSPLNLWSNDISNIISNEQEILDSILSLSKPYRDIIFGIPQDYISLNKSMTYAITILFMNTSTEYRQELKNRLFALDDQQDDIIHIYFSRKSFVYYLPLILIYIVVFLYIYYSVNQFECVKSKWGLALAATVQIVASLLISLAISSLFHTTPRLDGGEIFPYLVIFIGLENLVVLTRSVTSLQAQKQFDDIRERVAYGLRSESWTISKHLFYELIIVLIGYLTYVPTVREFCLLALIGILIDFFMQIHFWLAVLSIDIRRFTIGRRRNSKKSLPIRMTNIIPRKSTQSQWFRYRFLQRGFMIFILIWFILIFYKSSLIVDLLHKNVQINREEIKDFIPEKMLNEHFGSESFSYQYQSNEILQEHTINNISSVNFEWPTLLSFDHWPTLFSYYNISYDNRYLTIMPSIYLPIINSDHQQLNIKINHIQNKTSSPSSNPSDYRFSSAIWELFYIILFGLIIFTVIYFYFKSSSNHNRTQSCIINDYPSLPTVLPPPLSSLLIESLCINENGIVLTVVYSNGFIRLWNLQTGGIISDQQRYSSSETNLSHVWCSLMLNDQTFLLGCSDNSIEFYSYSFKSQNIISCENDLGGITHLIRVSSIFIISITRRGYLITFEYINNRIRQIYIKRLHQWPIHVCKIDPNGSLVFTGSDDYSIKVTDISDGLCLYNLHKHQAPVNCLAIDPYNSTIFVSGCFNGTLCLWNKDSLIQSNTNAHPLSIILDVNFCGHSSNIISLGTDKRLCIWTYNSLQLIYELHDITSNCFLIHCTNYLFYIKSNSIYIYDIFNQQKLPIRQFIIPLINENDIDIDKIIYSSHIEMFIFQSSNMVYAMHLPQQLFLVR
ncbi:unnamed protein product [Adineta steineri]|uniref:Sterol regulatory element-binding protein cleavage-activating protein n=1 Tax=Adineta steineri TaxID=433720 RepID=A0A818MBU8_9BILA|nr:unnamed protein product [Adineta steineri]CAF3579048.1 unnamed protein product [Adineta steineri]